MKLREIVIGAVLTALALMIPLMFGFLRIVIPPFSATLASHVPVFLAMTLGPLPAAMVGFGSTIGFLYVLGPVVAARASIHIVIGVAGAYMYRTGLRATNVMLATLPMHAIGEALIVVPFGFHLYRAGTAWYTWPGLIVGVGTIPHHVVDMIITLVILALLKSSGIMTRVRI